MNAKHVKFVCLLAFQCYSKYSNVDVAKAIDLELKGDIESLLDAVGKMVMLAASSIL